MRASMNCVSEEVSFPSGDLTLEGILYLPDSSDKIPGVVICHPHPRFGGDMHNGIVLAVARSVCNTGMAGLAFNTGGTGNSEGTYSDGVGEIEDALHAISYLSLHDRVDASRLGIAGYSFGASVALEACTKSNLVQAVASVACTMSPFRDLGVRELLQPKLLIGGELDHNFPAEQFNFLAKRFMEPKEVKLLDGADHFFGGREAELGVLAAEFFARFLGTGSR